MYLKNKQNQNKFKIYHMKMLKKYMNYLKLLIKKNQVYKMLQKIYNYKY